MQFPSIPDQDQKRRILERVELELEEKATLRKYRALQAPPRSPSCGT